jgi:hypothetical protein
MKLGKWSIAMALVLIVAGLQLSACSDTSTKAKAEEEAPATVEPIKGTERSTVKLSEQAFKRLGIRTGTIRETGSGQKVMPYASVLYDAEGKTFTYTSPEPRLFVRRSISVRRIEGSKAILSNGPPAGTSVVTVGSQELYGSEYEVEED